MCTDCEFHRNMRRDASLHAVEDVSVELGTGNKKKAVTSKKKIAWRKFSADVNLHPALARAQADIASGKLDGIEK